MSFDLRYLGTSGVRSLGSAGEALAFAPNLSRPPVFFDGELRDPLRFREAVSALHEVVVGDLRQKPKDRSRWLAWQAERAREEDELRRQLFDQALVGRARDVAARPLPPGFDAEFKKQHRLYWNARVTWANELWKNDPALFRALVPCDPVVTVAPDVVFFEAFAKDESAYGCLTVDRASFDEGSVGAGRAGLGTTNVDYSLALFDHFQTLRSYRATRLLVDPAGFEVASTRGAALREEKIDLPTSWLRGFGQLQAAMALPSSSVELSVDVVYSILAYLKRHREKTGPRSLRLSLAPGARPIVTLDPWGVQLTSRGAPYDGAVHGEIKLWGRRRLMSLARLLPLAERIEVRVFGSGLPSFLVVHMRDMRFVLGLSGWTANDWTRGSNLDTFVAGFEAPAGSADLVARYLEVERTATIEQLERQTALPRRQALAAVHELAKRGQVATDFVDGRFRWRPILPAALTETMLGPENPELVAARAIVKDTEAKLARDEPLDRGRRFLGAVAAGVSCEGIVDLDGAFTQAKCGCSYFFQNRLRKGPCRHLLALRMLALPTGGSSPSLHVHPAEAAQGLLAHLPEPLVLAMQQEADRRGLTFHAVAEQSWRIARAHVTAASNLDALLGTAPGADASAYRGGTRIAQLVVLPRGVESEVQREAARLDVSVSRIVEAAWLLARDTMRLTSSLLG